MGPTVGELMSEQHLSHEDEDEDEDEEEEEEEDDFVPRRRHASPLDEQGLTSPKRTRYSPSGPNGYAIQSPTTTAEGPSSSYSRSNQYAPVPGPSHSHAPLVRPPLLPGGKPPLEHSILNVEPVDEFIREIADFIHRLVANRTENIEIEAKIGLLVGDNGQRLRLPVSAETIPDTHGIRFEANMSAMQHRHYNTLLNNLGSEPPPTEGPRTPLKYNHTQLVDSFYPGPQGSREKLRVTVHEKTGRVVQCIRKVRLGDLNVYSPKRNADWRISVNLEIPIQQPTGNPLYTRRKDRMTYTHQYCNIDLTQVQQSSTATLLHELELELNTNAMPILMHSAARRHSTDPSLSQEQRDEFDDIVRIFVNNARILVRNATGT